MRLNSKILLRNIDRRDLLKVSLLTAAATMIDVDAQGATTTKLNILIGRPTDKSVALSLLSTINGTALIEYGYSKTQ